MSTITDSEIIIIGSGAIGCAAAYALAKAGKKDLLLLERAPALGQATTSQGAGLCGQVRDSVDRVHLARHSVETFRTLQQDPDVQPDWHEVGSLRIALSEPRVAELARLRAVCAAAGLEVELLDGAAAQRLWPLLDCTRIQAALWCPSDGWMTPSAVVQAYAHQCRKLGVRIETNTLVHEIIVENGCVAGVVTNRGRFDCRYVINAAGAHAYHVAQLVQLELPIIPVRHEYFVTVTMAGLTPNLPCFRIPELSLYGRVRDGGLLLGGWERSALHTNPQEFSLRETPPPLSPDWTVLNAFEQDLAPLLPAITGSSRAIVGKGWPTFTPDGRFIIGESNRVGGFVMAGGCNAHGISGSGGIGQLLVEALLEPKPSEYVQSLSPNRFTDRSWDWEEAQRQARRVYETYYGV